MSYCRFSSDNFGCDLYIYHDGNRYVMHVAGNRVVGEVPKLAPFTESTASAWVESHKKQMAFLDTAKRERIEMQHSGGYLTFEEPEELESKLKEMRALGYRFPDYVFEAIEEDKQPNQNDRPKPIRDRTERGEDAKN